MLPPLRWQPHIMKKKMTTNDNSCEVETPGSENYFISGK
jgi:hypothetical protein